MVCCKAGEYGWCKDEETKADPSTHEEFCLFHAPAELKWIKGSDFNTRVFSIINKHATKQTECFLNGTIFPFKIHFQRPSIKYNFPNIYLNNTHFLHRVDFSNIKFSDFALFKHSTFEQAISFHSVEFLGYADFHSANINNRIDFIDVFFNRGIGFICTNIEKSAWFYDAVFNEESYFRDVFTGTSNIHLHRSDQHSIHNIRAYAADINKFYFHSCDWPKKLYPETQKRPDYKFANELYRALKQKAANEHDQPMVSKWHYREKLMPLKAILGDANSIKLVDEFDELNPWATSKAHYWQPDITVSQLRLHNLGLYAQTELKRFGCWLRLLFTAPFPTQFTLTWWYWTLAGFGERPQRAFAWLVILPLLLLWLVPNDWRYGLPLYKVPDDKGSLWAWLCQIIITLQATLFAFALRNKFRR